MKHKYLLFFCSRFDNIFASGNERNVLYIYLKFFINFLLNQIALYTPVITIYYFKLNLTDDINRILFD